MRFRGGGIGHKQPGFTTKPLDENSSDMDVDDPVDETVNSTQPDLLQQSELETRLEDEEVAEAERCPDEYPDYGSIELGLSDDGESDSEVDIGDGYASM
jgi:hypothetical protein